MNTKQTEALKLALEALNLARAAHGQMLLSDPPQEAWKAWGVSAALTKAMTAASEALAEQPAQQQEPIAWIERDMQCDDFDPDSVTCQKPDITADGWEWVPLYITTPRKPWVGLTDEEIEQVCVPLGAAMLSFTEVARAIEAKLREKNA